MIVLCIRRTSLTNDQNPKRERLKKCTQLWSCTFAFAEESLIVVACNTEIEQYNNKNNKVPLNSRTISFPLIRITNPWYIRQAELDTTRPPQSPSLIVRARRAVLFRRLSSRRAPFISASAHFPPIIPTSRFSPLHLRFRLLRELLLLGSSSRFLNNSCSEK